MRPATRDLRNKYPLQCLHHGGFELVDTIVMAQLAVLSSAKRIQTTVFGDYGTMEATTTNLKRFLAEQCFHETRRQAIVFRVVAEATKLSLLKDTKARVRMTNTASNTLFRNSIVLTSPCIAFTRVRQASRVKTASLYSVQDCTNKNQQGKFNKKRKRSESHPCTSTVQSTRNATALFPKRTDNCTTFFPARRSTSRGVYW